MPATRKGIAIPGPQYNEHIIDTVKLTPGSWMDVALAQLSSTKWQVSVGDNTSFKSLRETVDAKGAAPIGSTGECSVERPLSNGSPTPLLRFTSPIEAEHCFMGVRYELRANVAPYYVLSNGRAFDPSSASYYSGPDLPAYRLNMESGKTPLDTTSPSIRVAGGDMDKFFVTFSHST